MDQVETWIAIITGIVGLIAAINHGANGKRLQKNFQGLGVLAGRKRAEIEQVVGAPQSISTIGDQLLLQWMQDGYHISLLFKDDVCQGVQHESSFQV